MLTLVMHRPSVWTGSISSSSICRRAFFSIFLRTFRHELKLRALSGSVAPHLSFNPPSATASPQEHSMAQHRRRTGLGGAAAALLGAVAFWRKDVKSTIIPLPATGVAWRFRTKLSLCLDLNRLFGVSKPMTRLHGSTGGLPPWRKP